MSNKFVALLLLVCVVTVNGRLEDGRLMTPEACYDYCYRSMMYPKFIADPICKYRCKYPMYENRPKPPPPVNYGQSLHVRKAGSPTSSPTPTPKIH